MEQDSIKQLAMEVINSNKYALVGTTSLKRYPNIRALGKMKNEDLKVFYFMTRAESMKVKQMKRRKKGCVYFYDQNRYIGVMLEGRFEIEPNTTVGISEIYKIDPVDPYDFCTIKFTTKYVNVYNNYETTRFEI